jgi:hypothetical protein
MADPFPTALSQLQKKKEVRVAAIASVFNTSIQNSLQKHR